MSEESENPTAGHEERDVPARIPGLFVLFMLAFVPLCLLGLWALMASVWEELPGPPNPFAGEPVSAPAAPQLQVSPETDLAELNRKMSERLHGVGWINQAEGRVYLPIDRAMQLLAERGLPEQGTHANEGAVLEEPSVDKGVSQVVETKVNVSAARMIDEPDRQDELSDGQEAGNE